MQRDGERDRNTKRDRETGREVQTKGQRDRGKGWGQEPWAPESSYREEAQLFTPQSKEARAWRPHQGPDDLRDHRSARPGRTLGFKEHSCILSPASSLPGASPVRDGKREPRIRAETSLPDASSVQNNTSRPPAITGCHGMQRGGGRSTPQVPGCRGIGPC